MKQNQIVEISISYTPSRYKQAKILSNQDAYDLLKEHFAYYEKMWFVLLFYESYTHKVFHKKSRT